MVTKALVVGSAPISEDITDLKLDRYHKIAVNRSWRLRRDFDSYVYLQSLPEEDRPPLSAVMQRIGVADFTPALRNAGGLYLTSGSVAMVAGYWALSRLGTHFLSYYGCDLVFSGLPEARTHFYGQGDEGPLLGNFQYNLRQRERSIRLLCWGLLHNVVITNISALEGTQLAFPKAPFHGENLKLHDDVLCSKEAQRLVRKAGNTFAQEFRLRTPAFKARQSVFEQDADALNAMNAIMDSWAELAPAVQDYAARAEELFEANERLKASNRTTSPAALLERSDQPYDLILHLGFHKTASTGIQKILETASPDLKKAGCQIVPHKKLRNNYTRLVEIFAKQSIGIDHGDPLSADLFKDFSQGFFESLKIQPKTRVVMSDENAVGHVGQCVFPGLLYRFGKQFVSIFASNLPAEPREVHVAIRDYASFFASCYTEYLGSAQKERFILPEVMVAKVMANQPSWCDLLESVRFAFPQSRLHVWCFEDFAQTMPDFLAALTGASAKRMNWTSRAAYRSRSSPGARGVALFLDTVRAEGVEAGLEHWKHIRHASEIRQEQAEPFNPWSPAQEAHLKALYARDVAQIARDERLILHRPIQAATKRTLVESET